MKKALSILFAMVTAFSISVVAFAANGSVKLGESVTVNAEFTI